MHGAQSLFAVRQNLLEQEEGLIQLTRLQVRTREIVSRGESVRIRGPQ